VRILCSPVAQFETWNKGTSSTKSALIFPEDSHFEHYQTVVKLCNVAAAYVASRRTESKRAPSAMSAYSLLY